MCRPSSRGSSLQRDFAHRPSPLTLSLYAFTACEVGFPGSKCIDLEDRTIPTHTDSPWQSGGARKELGVLREWITISICRARRHTAHDVAVAGVDLLARELVHEQRRMRVHTSLRSGSLDAILRGFMHPTARSAIEASAISELPEQRDVIVSATRAVSAANGASERQPINAANAEASLQPIIEYSDGPIECCCENAVCALRSVRDPVRCALCELSDKEAAEHAIQTAAADSSKEVACDGNRYSVLCQSTHAVYIVGKSGDNDWTTLPVNDKIMLHAQLAQTAESFGTHNRTPLIIFASPGSNADDEIALCLAQVQTTFAQIDTCACHAFAPLARASARPIHVHDLSPAQATEKLGLTELRLVCTTASPTDDSARIARGVLDTVGMMNVPVASYTSHTNTPHDTEACSERCQDSANIPAFMAHRRKSGYMPISASESYALLQRTFAQAEDGSLALLLLSSLSNLAAFIRLEMDLFQAKTASISIVGRVDRASLFNDEIEYLLPDSFAERDEADVVAVNFVFQRCQELKLPLIIVNPATADVASVPSFFYDELAALGHPVALWLRSRLTKAVVQLWEHCRQSSSPAEGSAGSTAAHDRTWFANKFCGGSTIPEGVSEPAEIWQHVTSLGLAGPLALLAAHSGMLQAFFDGEFKVVHGVEHIVIGAHLDEANEVSGVREVHQLRAFLMDALRYVLLRLARARPGTSSAIAILLRTHFEAEPRVQCAMNSTMAKMCALNL